MIDLDGSGGASMTGVEAAPFSREVVMTTVALTRRAALAGLGACGAAGLSGCNTTQTAAVQPQAASGIRIGAIDVDTAPLLAQSGNPTANWVQQAMPQQNRGPSLPETNAADAKRRPWRRLGRTTPRRKGRIRDLPTRRRGKPWTPSQQIRSRDGLACACALNRGRCWI